MTTNASTRASNGDSAFPVAIGGIGGSGTRVVATLLHMLGYFLGDDLNEFMDNLWFTLLFKRRSILVESESDFCSLVSLFFSRMSGIATLSESERARVFLLAEQERLEHSREWLIERAYSFSNGKTSKRSGQSWCWKEPNTHIVIDHIFRFQPNLRYIHVVRHPLDMAVSSNQNQLQHWGPIFLNRDVSTIEPRLSLSYWCAAHRRIIEFARSWPERTMIIEFDALCAVPNRHCAQIARFLGTELRADVAANFRKFVRRPESSWRVRSHELAQYDPSDLAYVGEIGYPL
jgi:Sulfotransferase family